jgi:hypothetical protein
MLMMNVGKKAGEDAQFFSFEMQNTLLSACHEQIHPDQTPANTRSEQIQRADAPGADFRHVGGG